MKKTDASCSPGPQRPASRSVGIAHTILVLALVATAAQLRAQPAVSPAAVEFSIPAASVAEALRAWAAQTGLVLRADGQLLEGRRSPGIAGRFTAREALNALLVGSGLSAVAGPDGAITLRGPDAENQTPQTVVVLGTKRSQGRQQATQSVFVVTERDTIGLQSALDVVTRIPNIAQQSDGFLPTIRGLDGNGVATGGGGAVTGANPRMSNYVDGVARTYGATPDGQGSLWDIAQVEVYRGAQSTLLGQNALAGAIVQTTKDPAFKDEAALQLGAHTQRTTLNGAFMLNKALSDTLAVRFTGEAIDGKTAIDYGGFDGTGLNADARDDLGRLRYGRYRFKALLAPLDTLTLKLTLEQERRRNAYTIDGASSSSRRELVGGAYGWFDSTTRVAAFNVNQEFGPQWSFDAVLSQQKADTQFGPPIVGSPDPAAYLDFSFVSTETALEPKLVYKAGHSRTGAVVGAFVKQRDRTDLGKPGSIFALTADDDASSRALFADATVQLNDAWDMLAAARFVDDRQQRSFSAFDGALAYNFNERNRVFLPKLGATYNASADTAFSLVAYQGYNPSGGGVSFVSFTPYQYRKESANTLELVARTQWWDRKLTINANLFFTRLKDTQASGIGPGGPDDGIYLNIAKARTRGLEFDLAFRPDTRTRVGLAIGLLDTRIVDFGTAANSANNGKQLGLAPRATANLNASFELLPRWVVGGDLALSSKRYSDYDNLSSDRVPGYGLVNLNVQYQVGKVSLTGYVNNVFDKFVQLYRLSSFNQAYVNEPRTLGLNLKAEF